MVDREHDVLQLEDDDCSDISSLIRLLAEAEDPFCTPAPMPAPTPPSGPFFETDVFSLSFCRQHMGHINGKSRFKKDIREPTDVIDTEVRRRISSLSDPTSFIQGFCNDLEGGREQFLDVLRRQAASVEDVRNHLKDLIRSPEQPSPTDADVVRHIASTLELPLCGTVREVPLSEVLDKLMRCLKRFIKKMWRAMDDGNTVEHVAKFYGCMRSLLEDAGRHAGKLLFEQCASSASTRTYMKVIREGSPVIVKTDEWVIAPHPALNGCAGDYIYATSASGPSDSIVHDSGHFILEESPDHLPYFCTGSYFATASVIEPFSPDIPSVR